MKRIIVLSLFTAIFLCAFTGANAMTGTEFMGYSILDQSSILKPIIIKYISEGYKKVPDWYDLSKEIDIQIRRWGMGNKDLEDIALEAAKVRGMTQW